MCRKRDDLSRLLSVGTPRSYAGVVPRLVRFDAPRAIHHVFAQGVGPSAIFRDAGDYDAFIAIARRTFAKLRWQSLIHCLMTTHYHFVIRTENADLSVGMQRINGSYARTFNRTYGRRGHLFGDRFGSVFVQTQAHFLTEVGYVALNPLDAGYLPHEWPYSSYGNAIAGRRDPLSDNGALLELCGGVEKLRAVVEDGLELRERAA
jgi:REP element-mobilizing transposase RayT